MQSRDLLLIQELKVTHNLFGEAQQPWDVVCMECLQYAGSVIVVISRESIN